MNNVIKNMSNKLQLLINQRNLIEQEMAGFKGTLLTYAQDELRNLEFEISVLSKNKSKIETNATNLQLDYYIGFDTTTNRLSM